MPRKKIKPDEAAPPEITGSLGTGKQSTPSRELFSSIYLDIEDGLMLVDKAEAEKTRPAKRSKKQKDRK